MADSPGSVSPISRQAVAEDLRRLGVASGDLLFIHSSFKSLGPVADGAAAVIGAIADAVGPQGLILMPSFNLVEGGPEARVNAWDLATARATTGYLTEYFRGLPETYRSDHYSHSVAARGPGAAALVAEHRAQDGMAAPWDLPPWGKTYGDRSPMLKAYRHPQGKLLMLGVNYHSSTYCHLVETYFWNRRLPGNAQAAYYYVDRNKLGEWWDAQGRLRRGRVGQADCRLFSIRDFVDSLLAAVQGEPARFCKWYQG